MNTQNFRKLWCVFLNKFTTFTYIHFSFLSIYMHPLDEIVCWKMHNINSNNFKKFQENLIYHLIKIGKTKYATWKRYILWSKVKVEVNASWSRVPEPNQHQINHEIVLSSPIPKGKLEVKLALNFLIC